MPNTNAPFGFRPFQHREGSAPTMGMERFFINSSDTNLYFTGDIVNASSANGSFITNPSSALGINNTYAMLGVFQGCEYYSPAVGRVVWNSYFPGSVGSSSPCNAYVITDPDMLYIVQGTSGAVMTTTSVGLGCIATTSQSSLGNQATGQSVMTINPATVTGLSSNAVIRIVDLYSNYAPPGVNGTSTGAEGLQVAVVQLMGTVRNNYLGLTFPTT